MFTPRLDGNRSVRRLYRRRARTTARPRRRI